MGAAEFSLAAPEDDSTAEEAPAPPNRLETSPAVSLPEESDDPELSEVSLELEESVALL